MKLRYFLLMSFGLLFLIACSQPDNSNKEMSDTTQVYNKESTVGVDSGTNKSGLDSIANTGIDNNNQSPRVHTGKDTVGKMNGQY